MKIILEINKPENVTDDEVMLMALFMFMGHSITDDIASKFKYEEFDVLDVQIVR